MRDVDEVTFEVKYGVILLWKYTGKTKIAKGKYRENTENFVFHDELEPCMYVVLFLFLTEETVLSYNVIATVVMLQSLI